MEQQTPQTAQAKFFVGQLVHHKIFDYRGVVVDVDPTFQGTEEWYAQVARTRPPKDKPWYKILVHDADHETYVAERNMEPDISNEPINHPFVFMFFSELKGGVYVLRKANN
jgi:heat shock protein HspQ